MDTPTFADGLGRRYATTGTQGERLEALHLCAEIPATPQMQAALVERASALSLFRHASFAGVRRIERFGDWLAVLSDAVEGVRVSDLLRESERRLADRDPDAALHLLRQAVAALAALHRHAPDAAHGAMGPERLVVRPDGTIAVVEHVLASALAELQYSRLQLWALFRIPAPSAASTIRFDHQTDVLQLGLLALALFLGRVLSREEFPPSLSKVFEQAAAPDAGRNFPGLSRPIRLWLGRALHFEPRSAFRSAVDAEAALTAAVSEDASVRPSPAAVQRFLATCSFEALISPRAPDTLPSSPSGAVVIVGPPHAGVTRRVESRVSGAPPDRGSGAHRVSRQQAPQDQATRDVLVELAAAPADEPRRIAEEADTPAATPSGDVRPTRRWFSRLLPG